MSQHTVSQQTASVGEENAKKDLPDEAYDDAGCCLELHLANYVQSMHHEVDRYNFEDAIYHGISRKDLHDQTRQNLDFTTVLAMLMDTSTGPETATAVSVSIFGGSRTTGYQLSRRELKEKMLTKNMETRNESYRVCVDVRVAQGRDEVPENDLQNLHKLLVEADRFHQLFDAHALFPSQQDREIVESILPAIVYLSEAKIILILQQLPLLHRAWSDMILENQPEDCRVPTAVMETYNLIYELASAALKPNWPPEKRHSILAHIIHLAYGIRSNIDEAVEFLDAMERNWAGILLRQLRSGILPETACVVPHKYRGESFRGWRTQPLFEEIDLTDGEESDSDTTSTKPVKISRDYDKYSLPRELVKEYVAHNGIYSRLCPRLRDGEPLNPITYWLGALGKYWLAAKTLLYTPIFASVASRPKNVEVNIVVRGVPSNWFARYSQTASGRPDVPQTFDQFVHLQTETDVAPDRGYGSQNVRKSFERLWQDAIQTQYLFVHPEMKMLVFNAIDWRFIRELIIFHREDKQTLNLSYLKDIKDLKEIIKHTSVIGTSRDICFSCRAFIRGWNGVFDEELVEDGLKRTRQCHCPNMVMGYKCQECDIFEDEPLCTKLRFILGSAGDARIQNPRNYYFDPSWLAPKITKPAWLELGKDQLVQQLKPFLETINLRTELAIRTELHGLLGEAEIQTLLEYAAEDGFGDREEGEFNPHTHQIWDAKDFFLVPSKIYREQDSAVEPPHSGPVQHLENLQEQNRVKIGVAPHVQHVQPVNYFTAQTTEDVYEYPRRGGENQSPAQPPMNISSRYDGPINRYNEGYTSASGPLTYGESFHHSQLQAALITVPAWGSPSAAVDREDLHTRPFPTSLNFVPIQAGGSSRIPSMPGPFDGRDYYSTQSPYPIYNAASSNASGVYGTPGPQYPYTQTGLTFAPHLYPPGFGYTGAPATQSTLPYWGASTAPMGGMNSTINPPQTPANFGTPPTRPTPAQGSGYHGARSSMPAPGLCDPFNEDLDRPNYDGRSDAGAGMTKPRW